MHFYNSLWIFFLSFNFINFSRIFKILNFIKAYLFYLTIKPYINYQSNCNLSNHYKDLFMILFMHYFFFNYYSLRPFYSHLWKLSLWTSKPFFGSLSLHYSCAMIMEPHWIPLNLFWISIDPLLMCSLSSFNHSNCIGFNILCLIFTLISNL